MFNPSESSDAYLILANDRDEMWFICNRHVRVVGLYKDVMPLRVALDAIPHSMHI